MRDPAILLGLLLLTLAMPGCDRGGEVVRSETQPEAAVPPTTPASGHDSAPSPVTDVKPSPSTPRIAASPAGPAGPAYFLVARKGVTRLNGGKFTLLASPSMPAHGLQIGGDEALWVASHKHVLRLQGDKFRVIASAGYDQLRGSISKFAVSADGHVWAVTFEAVAHHDGKTWTLEDKAKIGVDTDHLQDIAVDRGGKVFLATSLGIHVRDGGVWKALDLGEATSGQMLTFDSVVPAPDGAMYALASTALLRFGPAPGELARVPIGHDTSSLYGALGVSANGSLAARAGSTAIIVPAGGSPRVFDPRDGKDFRANGIRALAADDSGRLWVGSEIGTSVLGPGDAKTEWPGGSVPELTGDIDGIAVFGSGPTELPVAGPVRTGGLTGKLLRDGSPLAGVDVELCSTPGMMFTDSPCGKATVKFTGKSDERGIWSFADVPLGSYGLAVKVDDTWQIQLGSSVGNGMKADAVYDTGSITIERK